MSILEMAREGLRTELTSALYRATNEKKMIVQEGILVKHNVGFQTVNLTVAPLAEHGLSPGLMMVVFQEVSQPVEKERTRPASGNLKRAVKLEEELKLTRENLQSTIEELEATNEEIKSANEELQSNNEELQSTNEELDTSREELQSLNEELLTVNAELSSKTDLLTKANDDLKNYLNRTDIAIIFLDEELKIRSFTPATSDILNIRDIDIGRPLEEITSRLAYESVGDDAREVLRKLQPKELEVQRKDGQWYTMRILPYRTIQNTIGGLVISFLDINKQKQAINDLVSANKEMEGYNFTVANNLKAPLRHLDGFSQALLEDYAARLDETGKNYLQNISEASKLMSRYLDRLMELSSVTLAEFNYIKVDLSQVAQTIATKFQTSYPQRHVDFLIQPGLVASGDLVMLELVLEKLLDNAFKFTQNVKQARIEFGITTSNGKQAFFVKDNGEGFNMAYANNLFAPFVQLHLDDKISGIGIGLAIVQRIVHRHGGEVWAESKPGEGATFYFTLS